MVIYLEFFNGQYTLTEALALDVDKIISLFRGFAASANANSENPYGVHEDAWAYIESAVSMIVTVHERHKEDPDRNPGYIEGPIAGAIGLDSLIVGYQGNEFQLRTLYDIVGWIFSVVGNVPVRVKATRENYYYPLMMIAYDFCTKLVPKTRFVPISKAPELWTVMWFKQMVNNQQVTRVVLGAILDKPKNEVKESTKEFRKNLLKEAGILKDGTPAPAQEKKSWGMVGQDFGHCAETYPLLFICSLSKDIRGSAEGISAKTLSLKIPSKLTITPYIDDTDGKVNPNIVAPCPNCRYLMEENGFNVARFEEGLTEGPGTSKSK